MASLLALKIDSNKLVKVLRDGEHVTECFDTIVELGNESWDLGESPIQNQFTQLKIFLDEKEITNLPNDDLIRLGNLICNPDRNFDCIIFVSNLKNRQVKNNGEFDESSWTKTQEIQPSHVIGFVNSNGQAVHWAYCISKNVFLSKWGHKGGLGVATIEMQGKFYAYDKIICFS